MRFDETADASKNRCESQGKDMNKKACRWAMRATVVVIAVLIVGCGLSEKEKQVIANLTTDMHTTCMGRFVIDLPQGMNTRGGYVILYYGLDKNFKTVEVTIQNTDTTPQKMADSIAAQAAEIAKDDNWKTKKPMLLEHRVINEHAIYLRYHNAFVSANGRKRELHLLVGETHLKLYARSYEGLPDEPGYPTEAGEKVDERLFKLASQIRAYDDAEKAGPGFCLGQVVIDSD